MMICVVPNSMYLNIKGITAIICVLHIKCLCCNHYVPKDGDIMDELMKKFLVQYEKEFDFYEMAGRIAAQQLENRLRASGIRAIVTSRAKKPDRLEDKIIKRHKEKKYTSIENIYEDIVDLTGIRVALYFPGERNEVDKIIHDQFMHLQAPKVFSGTTNPSYNKRFSGYWATHYRVQLKPSLQDELQNRYCKAKIEIQVASVLMHAWSEVEHDLVYKPIQGSISESENAILDEINGLVLTGEIALERLQKAIEERIAQSEKPFSNHYELASYLFEETKRLSKTDAEPMLGDVIILYDLTKELGINSPEAMSQYISQADANMENRSLTQQIIDQIILADEERYKIYRSILANEKMKNAGINKDVTKSIGKFMSVWINFEILLRKTISQINPDFDTFRMRKGDLINLQILNTNQADEFEYLRRIRNNLVHGIEIPDSDYIKSATNAIKELTEIVKDKFE